MTDEWIRTQIVPNISNHFHSQFALVLGRAILWAAFNPDTSEYVPENIRRRINTFYTEYVRGSLPAEENPIQKVQLIAAVISKECFF